MPPFEMCPPMAESQVSNLVFDQEPELLFLKDRINESKIKTKNFDASKQ